VTGIATETVTETATETVTEIVTETVTEIVTGTMADPALDLAALGAPADPVPAPQALDPAALEDQADPVRAAPAPQLQALAAPAPQLQALAAPVALAGPVPVDPVPVDPAPALPAQDRADRPTAWAGPWAMDTAAFLRVSEITYAPPGPLPGGAYRNRQNV
jgi:hypothetical protein